MPSFTRSRFPVARDFLQLGAQFRLANDFRGALLEVGKLFVDGCEVGHVF